MTTANPTRNLLDLHMPIDPNGSVSATAPLAWCVTRELMDEVQVGDFKAPHLLVIVRAQKTEGVGSVQYDEWFDRRAFVVPLQNALVYTSFNTDGEHEVHAFVVDVPDKEKAKSLKRWLHLVESRGRNGLSSAVTDEGRLRVPDFDDYEYGGYMPELDVPVLRQQGESLSVFVPADMFAPPPAAWRQKLVKKFFTEKAVDQCHFRKRFFFVALPLSALIAPLYYLAKVVLTVFGYAAGFRGFAVKTAFKHPLAEPMDLWDASPKVWYAPIMNKEGDERPSIWSIFNLPVAAVVFVLVWGVTAIGVGTVAIAALLALAVFSLALGSHKALTSDFLKSAAQKRREAEAEAHRIKTLRDLENMLCETNLPANSVSDLPREKRTVSLRFYDFKTKVCKPFAT